MSETRAQPGPASAVVAVVTTRLGALLLIRPGEGRRTALLFAHLLLASAIFILGRTVRDTLFLSRYSVDALPWMFVLYGAASAVTVAVYGRFADRIARHRVIGASAALGVTTYLGVWVLVRAEASFVYPVFYVWSEVFANLFIVQFWTMANDLHDARSAKRLFGTIGAARVLGVIVIGLTAGSLVRVIGTEQLLFILAGMMVLAALIARRLKDAPRSSTSRSWVPPPAKARPITADGYVRGLSLMILLAFTALTVGDYQFKVIARVTYQEDELAQFFSLFYAATGIVSLAFQVTVTPGLLRRFGVGWGMAVMPTVFGACSALLLAWPRLAIAAVMKFADNGFQYTIHDTTLQSLYVPFPASTKARTRAFLDAVVKPCSYGAGGLVLIVAAPRIDVDQLSWITTALVLLWLLSIPVVKRRYARSLQTTLSARGLLALEEADIILDASALEAITRALRSGDTRYVLAALDQVDCVSMADVVGDVESLTESIDDEVRASALDKLAAIPHRASPGLFESHLSDDVARIRATAARAFAEKRGDDGIDRLVPLTKDPSRKVRVAAVGSLMLHGGVAGSIIAGRRLAELLAGPANRRAEAARVLGDLGPKAYRPLVTLLEDPKPKVRRAALRACAGVADPRLIAPLKRMLSDPACRTRAASGLVAIGEPAVRPLATLLGEDAAPRELRATVPSILRRIGSSTAVEALEQHLNVKDSLVRAKICHALSSLRQEHALPPMPQSLLAEFLVLPA